MHNSSDIQYVVTSHSYSIRPDNPMIVELTRLGYLFEPSVTPVVENGFCGPDMDTMYTRKSILNSHICIFGFIPSAADSKTRRHHIHSVLTMNALLGKEVYINALCVNKIKNYGGAGKLLRDMIVAMRSIGIRRMTLDAIPSENTIQFYNKHKFDTDSWYSPNDRLMKMERVITPPESINNRPGTPGSSQRKPSINKSPTITETNDLLSWLDHPEELQDIIKDIEVMPDKHVEITFNPLPPSATQNKQPRTAQQGATRRAFRTRRSIKLKPTGVIHKAPRQTHRQDLSKGLIKKPRRRLSDITVKMPKMVMV